MKFPPVRRIAPFLLVVVGLVAGLQPWGTNLSRRNIRFPSELARAEEDLTLLDVWSQTVVPDILLEQASEKAMQVGNVAKASRLERQVLGGLPQVEQFYADATRDRLLRGREAVDVRAVRAVAAAWGDWARAVLSRARGDRTHRIAELELTAVRLHQAAYTVVDGTFRTAVLLR